LVHSTHSRVRASQRGLSNEKITATLTYGKMVCKQGMEYYILTSKDIPAHLEHMKKELENTVVLLSATGCLITCYRRNNPFRHIYKKSKTLY
jgi:hypothetical protein